MSVDVTGQISSALASYSSATRLFALKIGATDDGMADTLMVEAFCAVDGVQETGERDIIALSTDPGLDMHRLLGEQAQLRVSLADGTRSTFAGDISGVGMLGSNGSLTRYRIRLSHWIWRLSQVRNSRVWQDNTVMAIVDSVFGAYSPVAQWRWSAETGPFLDQSVPRSYCCQYRETDLDFVRRLLAEEGLGWRFEQGEDGPVAVLFADSTQLSAVPEDPSSQGHGGVRFHNARAGESQDTVQALHYESALGSGLTTVLSYDYKSKKVIHASTPSRLHNGKAVPALEAFDAPGQYAYTNAEQAQRYADLHMQGIEARRQQWRGRSTLRTLRAGTRLTILGAPLQVLGDTPAFTVLRVTSVGVNNLPAPAAQALAELFGPIPELLEEIARASAPPDFALVVKQARSAGYANCFEAVMADVPWRAPLPGSDGRTQPRPTAPGSQSAIVVGADGHDQPCGADELYCDRLGRVRIRYHWQDSGEATCWVRVAQRSAGAGMGSQFLPRIGQEVLVQFLESDIDRPIIVGALYNGQGEGGVTPTPGGLGPDGEAAKPFDAALDHAPSGQGNLAGGNSPLWHGASSDTSGHRNGAALWGVRSKEFGGSGYNQLLFDDTDEQSRIQLKSTHAASELNLGHLIHNADNYRGSFRGLGAELRTDAFGAVRAGAGLLITSYKMMHSATSRDPAGDNAPAIAMLKQATTTAEAFSKAAATHQTVALAAHIGAVRAGQSSINDQAAPLKALLTAVSGMVSSDSPESAQEDALAKQTAAGDNKLPHTGAAIIGIAAQAGLGVVAGESMQLASGETVTLMSGKDMQFTTAGQMRVHTRQAIGVLGGAMQAGENNLGLQMIAAKDDIDVQAQAGAVQVQARDEISITSAHAHIDWAAARRISLSTAGGANITIEGGNITVQCPGNLVINAGTKHFAGPEKLPFAMPDLPSSICVECLRKSLAAAPAFTQLG